MLGPTGTKSIKKATTFDETRNCTLRLLTLGKILIGFNFRPSGSGALDNFHRKLRINSMYITGLKKFYFRNEIATAANLTFS